MTLKASLSSSFLLKQEEGERRGGSQRQQLFGCRRGTVLSAATNFYPDCQLATPRFDLAAASCFSPPPTNRLLKHELIPKFGRRPLKTFPSKRGRYVGANSRTL